MPTISIFHKDFESLIGRASTIDQIENWLTLVKGELKDHTPATGEIRVELQDSNRPDLWCVEGIARQIRIKLQEAPIPYPFLQTKSRPKQKITVAKGMEEVRPFVAACCSTGYRVTEEGLTQLIQVQEKLADIFGHKRQTVSIGLYRLNKIHFPVTYGLVKPEEARFTPLGFSEKLTLKEILTVHPKGIEYSSIFADHPSLPLLWDKEGQILSFPPIINSREIGEVQVGDSDLLVEVTGTDLRMVLLTLNIFAANLADRGAAIEPIEIVYPYATKWGKTIRTPCDISEVQKIPLRAVESALGLPMGVETVQRALTAYGYQVKTSRHTLAVRLPSYRSDVMHPIDVAEDVAISRGYESFAPIMPRQFTVGSLSALELTSDYVRDQMVGMGFQEMFSNILMSHEDLVERMQLTPSDHPVVEVDNVMSLSFSCLRSWILPSLLRIETASPRAFYPHRLFEIGEVAVPNLSLELGSKTVIKIAGLTAHPHANFSEIHTSLDVLMYYLVQDYTLEPTTHGSFLEGRVGKIMVGGQSLGLIGELHPEVLEAWQISMPISVFELEVDALCREDREA
ncbi:MAG: phenylalanine--tRNA ligase subunit beta [Nitrospirales bacterium]